ncbi:MAG TPA: SulP family inorganic anion transporter, partial [Sorangium sp.]|nr:SulP family inorganic anion transporter [Sorangium sp.]
TSTRLNDVAWNGALLVAVGNGGEIRTSADGGANWSSQSPTGLLILAALGPYLSDTGLLRSDGLSALATLTLMAGLIRIVAAYAGGAALIDFIPESVLAGFTAGAGVLIAVMQLDEGLGLSNVRGGSLIAEVREVWQQLSQGGGLWPAMLVTVGTVAVVLIGKKVRPRFPAALLAVVGATLVALFAGLNASKGLPVVADRAAVPSGWPAGALPSLDPQLITGFLGPAAAIALLGTMELAVSARRGGARPDMRREIAAQGLANLVGAFASSFPASASLTRSALLKLGGAESRMAAAIAAVVVVPILYFGSSLVAALPQASLAGVLFVTAIGMIDLKRLKRMWDASRLTGGLLLVTFISTMTLPLEWGIFIGAGLGVFHYLATGKTPRVQLLQPSGVRLVPTTPDEAGDVVIIEVSGNCHFAAAGSLLTLAEAVVPKQSKHVIIDLSHAHAMRFAALLSLESLDVRIRGNDGHLYLAGVPADFVKLLDGANSPLDVTAFTSEPLASVQAVLRRVEVAGA